MAAYVDYKKVLPVNYFRTNYTQLVPLFEICSYQLRMLIFTFIFGFSAEFPFLKILGECEYFKPQLYTHRPAYRGIHSLVVNIRANTQRPSEMNKPTINGRKRKLADERIFHPQSASVNSRDVLIFGILLPLHF